jgi:hypothetical protein
MPSTPFKGRADLVAHIGQELRLGEVGALGAVAGLDHLGQGGLLTGLRRVQLAQHLADAQRQGQAGDRQQQHAGQDERRGLAHGVQARLLGIPGQPTQGQAARIEQGDGGGLARRDVSNILGRRIRISLDSTGNR